MAGKEIRYEIDVNASDAKRGLTEFSRAATKAGKEAAKGLEDTATAGDKARAAIKAMAETFDTELRGAAAAADALGQALGPELTGRMDVNEVVLDLEKMGVTFDEIRLEADAFATTLRQVDDIRLSQTTAGLDGVRTKMDQVRSSSDQSRSVLANLAGNAAQDLGQLGGVVGSLGVGIGQLAEYAVDGNIALGNLAKVAGPLAAISLVLAGVNKYLGEQTRIKAFREEQVEGYAEAIEDLGVGLGAIEEHLTNVADESFSAAAGITDFVSGSGEIPNVAAAFGVMGVKIEEVSAAIAAGASETDAGKRAANQLQARLESLGFTLGDNAQLFEFVREQQDAYATSSAEAAAETKFFGDEITATTNEVSEMMRKMDVTPEFTGFANSWLQIIENLRDGGTATDQTTQAINYLAEALGMTTQEVLDYAQTKLDEKIEAEGEAAEEAAAKHDALTEAVRQLGVEMGTTESRAAGIAGAFDTLNDSTALSATNTQETLGFVNDMTGALEALGEVDLAESDLITSDWKALLDEDLGAAVSAVGQWRDSVQSEMAQAFAAGGPAELTQWSNSIRANIEQTMRDSGDFTEAAIQEVIASLGLLPEQVTTTIQLAEKEQTIEGLRAVVAAIEGIPPSMRFDIEAALNGDNPATALELINSYLTSIGETEITVPMLVNDDGTVDDFTDAADEAAEERNPQFLVPKSDSLGQMETLLNAVARQREVQFVARSDNAGAINDLLNYVARFREQHTYATVDARNAFHTLDLLDEPRTVHVHVVTHQHGGIPANASPGTASVSASTRGATPAATSSVVAPTTININAAVIGNRYDVERVVSGAVRNSIRLAGRRQLAVTS